MSVRINLHCNTVRGYSACARSLSTDGFTIDEARAIGDAHGWRHSAGRDYCPGCSGTRTGPRVIVAFPDEKPPRVPELRADELLVDAGAMLTALVNGATPGAWTYRPGIPGRAATYISGGERGTECVARTGPASNSQATFDAAYIAAAGPETGRAVAALLREAGESVAQEQGLVQDSLSQAAVDVAAAIHRTNTQAGEGS